MLINVYFFATNVLHCTLTQSVLMLDEAHERTLYTDIAIGLLKKVMPAETNLNFTLMSLINLQLFK